MTPDPRNVPVGAITIVFSEPVTGFDPTDLTLTRDGAAVSLAGATLATADNVTWTLGGLAVPTAADGTYVLALAAAGSGIQDAGGNALAADAGDTFVVDTTPPAADILDVTPDPRNGPVGIVTIQFTEPVTGFDLPDLVLTRDGAAVSLAGATLATADNVTWTLGDLTGLTGTQGTYVLRLTAASSGIVDAAGNALAADAGDTFVVDTAPTADILDVTPDPRNVPVGAITIVFSEPVTGFDPTDLTLTRDGIAVPLAGATLATADNVTWTLGSLAGPTAADGTYVLTLTAVGSSITDAAGNALAADAGDTFVVDATPPTADILDVTPDPRTGAVGIITIRFSEPVTGFDLADLTLTRNGTAVPLAGRRWPPPTTSPGPWATWRA